MIRRPTFVLVHAFDPDPLGHGGSKRSHQVQQAFQPLGDVLSAQVYSEPGRSTGFARLTSLLVRGYAWQLRHGFISGDPKAAVLLGAAASFVDQLIARFGRDFILVWEGSTSCNWFLGMVAKGARLRVIALPHNIDSLVAGNRQPFLIRRHSWLEIEARLYSCCDLVLGISHEDVWLLRLHRANAQWWPYATTEIRRNIPRSLGAPYCLTFGTALNAPTREGMRTISQCFRAFLPHVTLKVAGRGTQVFREDADFAGVECLGEVDAEDLDRLIRDATCIVVHQPPATGALTRLVDLDNHDIPVLCNVDAFRSAHFLANAVCYASDQELVDMVQRLIDGGTSVRSADALDLRRVAALVHADCMVPAPPAPPSE